MQSLTLIQVISVWIVPTLLAITVHEMAHAWIASCCGDSTARRLGRLSINPFRHIDRIGTIVVPIVVAVLSGFHFVFGWAKPVPISWQQLRHPRRDMALVAVAGPVSNILMALIWAGCVKVGMGLDPDHSWLALFMVLSGEAGILINLVLAFLNLIPIPPLDGSRIVAAWLSPKYAAYYAAIEPFGFIIVVVLMFTGSLGVLINAPILWSVDRLHILFHIMN